MSRPKEKIAPQEIRVMLVEDHAVVREGLRALISSQANMSVIGEADNGRDAVRLIKELRPDVIVMDISMPEMNGLKATAKLLEVSPRAKILILTRHTDSAFVQELLRAGVSGYVLKQSSSPSLIRAIHTVFNGGKYLDPAITAKVMDGYVGRQMRTDREAVKELSEREAEVLRLIAWGYSNKEIAARLDISVKTVEAHKANLMRKMDFTSRIDIVRYALLQGWLQEQ